MDLKKNYLQPETVVCIVQLEDNVLITASSSTNLSIADETNESDWTF